MRAFPAPLVLALVLWPATALADEDPAARVGAGREPVGSLAGALKDELRSAMAAVPTVIGACSSAASAIAATASDARAGASGARGRERR